MRELHEVRQERDWLHHGSRGSGVSPASSTSSPAITTPRSTPNTIPSVRSVPDMPVFSTSTPAMRSTIPHARSTRTKSAANAMATRTEGTVT